MNIDKKDSYPKVANDYKTERGRVNDIQPNYELSIFLTSSESCLHYDFYNLVTTFS